MLGRLEWALYGRHVASRKVENFWASIGSYVRSSYFGGNNRLYGTTGVMDSSIGRYTYVAGAQVSLTTVGAFCSIGPRALLGGLGRHPTNYLSTHPAFYSITKQAGATFADRTYYSEQATLEVGNDVWIGANAIILDGLKIGDGVIVAAGSVVTKSIPPYAIIGGCPARVIRYRFDEKDIERLLSIRWWDLSDPTLRKVAEYLRGDDVYALEEAVAKLVKPHSDPGVAKMVRIR